jgi:phosphate transport system substrate-binding protein
MNFIKTIVAAGLVAVTTSAFAADITGAGATFPFPIYSKWADAYKKETGNGLNYQSIGSGAGIADQAKTVTFGASDMPLKADSLRLMARVATSYRRASAGCEPRRHQAGG